jgi:hypothetical protein
MDILAMAAGGSVMFKAKRTEQFFEVAEVQGPVALQEAFKKFGGFDHNVSRFVSIESFNKSKMIQSVGSS